MAALAAAALPGGRAGWPVSLSRCSRRPLPHTCHHASSRPLRPVAALTPAALAATPAERTPPSPSKLRWEVALSHHDISLCEAEVAQLIAADPTSVEAASAGGNRPLHLAAARARRGLPAAGAIRLLLAAGARPDALNARGDSATHMLVREPLSGATLGALRALLRGGASPGLPGPDGLPPLHTAAGFADGSAALRVIKVLLEAGADVNQAASADGNRPLHRAALNGGLYWPPISSLGPAGSGSPGSPLLLLPSPAGRPTLRIKQSAGAVIVAALVAAGADVSARNAAGLSALHACAAHARQPAAAAAVVAALATAGADLDAPDAAGKLTAMHHALRNTSPAGPAVLAALAEAGASVRPLLERLN